MVVLATIAHIGAALLFLILPDALFSPSPPTEVAYTVKIVDANALGGRVPKGELEPPLAAEPEPKPEPKPEPEPAPDPVALEQKADPTPKPIPKPKPTPKPRRTAQPKPQHFGRGKGASGA